MDAEKGTNPSPVWSSKLYGGCVVPKLDAAM
jgi:hypothetical protein